MDAFLIMLSLFIVIMLSFLVVALTTGRAYYGQFLRYVERRKHPALYWLVVILQVLVLGISIGMLANKLTSN